jgi:hypothetical protein
MPPQVRLRTDAVVEPLPEGRQKRGPRLLSFIGRQEWLDRPNSELIDASRFASRALGLGILANLGSAVTGVADWQHTHEEDRRVGLTHGVLNGLATGIYVMSWLNRRRGRHGRGL